LSAGVSERASAPGEAWLFWALLAAFAVIYAAFYPRTYSIFDESCILALAYSIGHGTVFVDHAGPLTGFMVGAHAVSMYSVFHAALLAPALAFNWRLDFLVSAGFFVLGAFVVRAMLLRDGLDTGWSALYFLLAGALYYSQTLMAAVPAAVMGLIGVALLTGSPPRPAAGGLAFGASVLLHPWMGPMVMVFSAVWLCERRLRSLARDATALAIGALPCVLALGAYNYATVGRPFANVYVLTGHGTSGYFPGKHILDFGLFYIASLAVFPIAGWAVLSPRWSRGWSLPITAAVMLTLASFYFYRDGLNVGSARVGTLLGFVAGLIPGQRFLLPVSMIACVPAARFLNAKFGEAAIRWRHPLAAATLAVFAAGFIGLSAAHQAYLDAHLEVQRELNNELPEHAAIALGVEVDGDELAKELAPVRNLYDRVDAEGPGAPARGAYIAYLARPGDRPPEPWVAGRSLEVTQIRSWAWNRDLWIGAPVNPNERALAR
jgi:hypothetical protein